MLVQCWPTVCDAEATSSQHWFNFSISRDVDIPLAPSSLYCHTAVHRPRVNVGPAFTQHRDNPADMRH